MAEKLDEFKKEFAEIKKLVSAHQEEIDKDQRAIAQTNGIMEEGTKELGLRVQELKSSGMTGTTVDDFKADPQVKQMMASLNSYMSQIEKELTRITGLYNGAFKATKARFVKLSTGLNSEIATRKKAASTKLGTGNKSLPDLEKLLADIKKYDGTYTTFDAFVPEKAEEHQQTLNRWIKTEIGKTKEKALSELQRMMDTQAFNVRNLKAHFNRAKALHDEIMASAVKVKDAVKTSNNTELVEAQKSMPAAMKALTDLVSQFEAEWRTTGSKTASRCPKIKRPSKAPSRR